ncbi:MAG: insulinase family protein, partial [Caulobacteraceae bacterium]|nr:insulinase family protein [Caulobacteraceae bacterium]
GWTQTVYELDLPTSTDDMLDTGLGLMRETASELTLDPKALESERGVVLSEERLRDTPGYRAEKAQLDLVGHGQLMARRFPIGLVDVVQHAPASLVRDFYVRNYRPDRATVIAVGDFDAKAMEARIRARFGDWTPAGPPPVEPDLGAPEARGLTVKAVTVPGAPTRSIVAWAQPYDGAPDTAAKETREVIENLGLAVLNRRFQRLAQQANPPFLTAQAGYENLFHSDKVASVETTSVDGAWRPALAATEAEIRRVTTEGVSQAELDREIVEMRSAFAALAAGAPTRPSPTVAQLLVDSVDENSVFTSPAEDLILFDRAVKGLTVAQVDAALKRVFSGRGPLVELSTPAPLPGGDETLRTAFAEDAAHPLGAEAAQAAVVWPYADFGRPGRVATTTAVADLGVTELAFANGVRLTVKPTAFRQDQVLVEVRVGGGRRDLPADRPGMGWAAQAVVPGGLGKITFDDASRALAGKVLSANFALRDDAWEFTGQTRGEDLAAELQLLAAYLSDPGFRPEAFERLRAGTLAELPQLEATPGGVAQRELAHLISGGDPRFAFPTREQLLAAKPEDLARQLRPILTMGPVEITIVGDVTVQRATQLAAATFGALPRRAEPLAETARPLGVKFPGGGGPTTTLVHTGRADQGVAVAAWPLPDFYADMKRSRAAMLAGEVMENRLIDEVRIAEGATYSPETQVDLSQTVPGFGYAFAMVEMPPAKIPGFFDQVTKIAADMRARDVTADELDRARNPRVATLRRAQLTNEYWLANLAGAQADPRRLALIRTTFPDYSAVTTADIRASAQSWLRDEREWRLMVAPATAAPPK